MTRYSTSYWKLNIIYREGIKGVGGAEICIADKSQETTENVFHLWEGNLHLWEQREEQVKTHDKAFFSCLK